MSVVLLAHTPTPEGAAALEHAIEEAGRRDARLVVVSRGPHRHEHHADTDLAPAVRQLDDSGVPYSVQELTGDYDFAERVLAAAADEGAALIVIGVRHRTPVGKLLMASSAQRILLDSPCPVTAVKADAGAHDGTDGSGSATTP